MPEPGSDAALRPAETIHIIVLNWNGLEDTVECVDALQQQTYADFLLHLVDNGSDGNDAAALAQRYAGDQRIRLTTNAENLGFTGGVNRTLDAVLNGAEPPRAVVLLNNDTLPEPAWLESLVGAWHQGQASIVASCMINYYHHDQLDNAGHIWLDSGEILPRGTSQPPANFDRPAQIVGACAGAMLVSTALLRKIGAFDPFFETGYEDAEFGLRAFLAGYPTCYAPQARIFHKVSRSVDRIRSPRYAMRIQTNINYTYLKLAPWPLILLNSPWLLIKTVGVIGVAMLTLRGALVRAHLAALQDTWASRSQIMAARRQFQPLRRISVWRAWRAQRFFLPRYLRYFRDFILTGNKTVFER